MQEIATSSAVFDFLDASHRDIAKRLNELSLLMDAIDNEALDADVRTRGQAVLSFFASDARQHHLDEEKHVFPALLHSADTGVADMAARLSQDHGWIEENWLQLSPALDAALQGQCWFDGQELRHSVSLFRELYQDHMLAEETLAYPEARKRMNAQQAAGMGREMAKRRATRRETTA